MRRRLGVSLAGPATAPARDRHRRGPFRRLAGVAVRGGWDHVVPEQARTLLRTAFSGIAMGIIEPSARRFQYVVFKQHYSALAQMALGLDVGPAPSAYSGPQRGLAGTAHAPAAGDRGQVRRRRDGTRGTLP